MVRRSRACSLGSSKQRAADRMRNAAERRTLRAVISGEARQALAYTLTAALSRFGALLLVPIFWKRLTPADYGVIALTELTATIVASFAGLSLEAAMSRFYYEWPVDERRRRLGALWTAHWSSSIGLGVLALPVIWVVTPVMFPAVEFYPAIFYGVIYAVLGRMKAFVVATLRIQRLLVAFAVLHLGGFAVYVALALYFVLYAELGVLGYLYALVLGEAIVVVVGAFVLRALATPNLRDAGLREAFRYALPLVPNSLLGTASSIIDTFVLQHVASLQVLGIYSVSNRFVALLPTLVDALKMSFAPFLYQAASERGSDAPALIRSVRMYYLIPIMVGAACVAVFTEDLVRWIDQPEYFAVIYYVPLLVGPAVIDSMLAFFTSGLLLAKRTDLMWIPTVARLVAIVATGFVLIPAFQIDGLVASRYVTVSVNLAIAFYMSQRYYNIPVDWMRLVAMFAGLASVMTAAAVFSADELWLNLLIDTLLAAAFAGFALVVVVVRATPQSASHESPSR